MKRAVLALAACVAGLVVAPPVANADPPAATDYRTTIVAVDPPTSTIHPAIIGGDSFFELRVAPGTAVDVAGYRGEPYLRFLANGEVLENRQSTSYLMNRSRYTSSAPADADPDAEPRWHTVSHDGRYAWHDHRTHWMNTNAPLGARRGEVILEAVVPVSVDGKTVTIRVRSTWQPQPSLAPAIIGALAGLAAAVLIWLRRGSVTVVATVAMLIAIVATVIGAWQYWSVPAETGPSKMLITLPAVAVVSAMSALILRRRRSVIIPGLIALGAIELAAWTWQRRRHLDAAVLPTNSPWWLDRLVTSTTMVAAVGLAAATAVTLWSGGSPSRR